MGKKDREEDEEEEEEKEEEVGTIKGIVAIRWGGCVCVRRVGVSVCMCWCVL